MEGDGQPQEEGLPKEVGPPKGEGLPKDEGPPKGKGFLVQHRCKTDEILCDRHAMNLSRRAALMNLSRRKVSLNLSQCTAS